MSWFQPEWAWPEHTVTPSGDSCSSTAGWFPPSWGHIGSVCNSAAICWSGHEETCWVDVRKISSCCGANTHTHTQRVPAKIPPLQGLPALTSTPSSRRHQLCSSISALLLIWLLLPSGSAGGAEPGAAVSQWAGRGPSDEVMRSLRNWKSFSLLVPWEMFLLETHNSALWLKRLLVTLWLIWNKQLISSLRCLTQTSPFPPLKRVLLLLLLFCSERLHCRWLSLWSQWVTSALYCVWSSLTRLFSVTQDSQSHPNGSKDSFETIQGNHKSLSLWN